MGNVRGKKVFLTGGTGFFGKWFLETFLYINEQLQLNATITVLTRNPESFIQKFAFYKEQTSVVFIKGNILDFEFPSKRFDYIIHAATEADAALNSDKPLLMLDTITTGTRRILDFALQQNVTSVLFTSSGAVYGKQPSTITHIKEGQYFGLDINDPYNAYAEGKRLAELYCSIYYTRYNLPVKIARCFAFVGPYLPLEKHFAIGNFIFNAVKGEDIVIKGDGTAYRSYLYASDLSIWLWNILLKGKSNTPYNVGSDEDYDLHQIANTVAGSTTGIKVKIVTPKDPAKSPERYVPDINFIKQELGVNVSVNLKDGIRKTKNFYSRV
jgi:dTDP-glucose 4,6-dehydratase